MKVVRSSASRTGRLYPKEYSWYSFVLEAESTPEPWYGRKEIFTEKSSDIKPVMVDSLNYNLNYSMKQSVHVVNKDCERPCLFCELYALDIVFCSTELK
jgi:hypothetical protein